MFTGIVQAIGRIAALQPNASGLHLVIDRQGWSPVGISFAPGDSVGVSGVCLTLVACDARTLAFDVIAETLATSKLGELQVGDRVNLEPCLTAQMQLGGHFVQGHVDGVGLVARVQNSANEWRTTIAPPAELLDYIVPKGSVALDGVSLTIAAVTRDSFEVALIPTTLERTTLRELRPGDRINIETDILARTIVHFLQRRRAAETGVTLDSLQRAGFLG